MIRHSTLVTASTPRGGDLTALSRLRSLVRSGAAPTLSAAAEAAILGGTSGSIVTSWEATVELDSNRYAQAYSDAGGGIFYRDQTDPFATDPAGGQAAGFDAVGSAVASGSPWRRGRRTATTNVAVADVTFADHSSTPSSSPTDDATPSVYLLAAAGGTGERVGPLTIRTVPNADAPAVTAWTTSAATAVTSAAHASSPHPSGRRFTFTAADGRTAYPTALVPFPYSLATDRRFTMTAYLGASTATAVRFRLRLYATDGTTVLATFPTSTVALPAAGAGVPTLTRYALPVTVAARVAAGAEALDVAGMRLEVEVVTGTGAVAFAAPELYAGDDRGPLGGLAASVVPYGGLVLAVGFRDPTDTATTITRRTNRLDVHGDARGGHVTAASVYAGNLYTSGLPLGAAAGPGRLSIPYAETDTTDLRLRIEETSSAGGDVYVFQIDPQLVLDATGRVYAARVETVRETADATTSPVGSYQTGTCFLELDNSDRALSPLKVATIDEGHRLELAVRVHYADPTTGLEAIEVVPAGTFYSSSWDAPSDSDRATIEGDDLLGRAAGSDLAERVTIDKRPEEIIRALARAYLDLDDDGLDLRIASSYVVPYAYPTGNLGTYLADLARSVAAFLGVDRLERLSVVQRSQDSATSVATFTAENAVVSASTPLAPGSIRTVATVTSEPFVLDAAPTTLFELAEPVLSPTGGLFGGGAGGVRVFAPYSDNPALDVTVAAFVFTPPPAGGLDQLPVATVTDYGTFADVAVSNGGLFSSDRTITALTLEGRVLRAKPISASTENTAAVRRYGRRELLISAPLVQTNAQAAALASAALALYSGVGADGRRVPPIATVTALGLLLSELGDLVTLAEPTSGLSGDHRLMAHVLEYDSEGARSTVVARRDESVAYLVADVGYADDGRVTGY